MLVNCTDIMTKAREEGYAIGAFNAFDHPTVDAIISAAEEANAPVIVQIADWLDPKAPESKAKSVKDTVNLMRFIRTRAEVATVPVCIHLDHCLSYEGCIRAMHNGASSVMIDASMLPFAENIAITNKVIEAAHACGVSVESEIGHVAFAGDGIGDIYTTEEEAIAFYEATHVDTLAVAIGTAHGKYKVKPVLQYDLISKLREAIPAPLVMHGGTGLTPEQFGECARRGICKINIATDIHISGGNAVKALALSSGDKEIRYNAFLNAGAAAEKDVVTRHIGYFLTKSVC